MVAAPELIDRRDMPGGAAERPKGRARRRARGRAIGTHRGTCQGDATERANGPAPRDVPGGLA
eukprot:336552-Pyramimonas_sp.AAC.1